MRQSPRSNMGAAKGPARPVKRRYSSKEATCSACGAHKVAWCLEEFPKEPLCAHCVADAVKNCRFVFLDHVSVREPAPDDAEMQRLLQTRFNLRVDVSISILAAWRSARIGKD